MFHPFIKTVHVNIGEELRSEVTERQTYADLGLGVKTADDRIKKPQNFLIRNILAQNLEKRPVVDAREKLSDIALEHPNRSPVVTAGLGGELTEVVNGFVHSFFVPAGERVGDKRPIEKGIKDAVNGVMEQPVAHIRLVNMTPLGINNVKTFVGSVAVRTSNQ